MKRNAGDQLVCTHSGDEPCFSTCPPGPADVNYIHPTSGAFSMLNILGPTYRTCDGLSRRSFLKAGFLALGGLTLADHLRLKARAIEQGEPTRDTAVILFWCGGGPSHIDM